MEKQFECQTTNFSQQSEANQNFWDHTGLGSQHKHRFRWDKVEWGWSERGKFIPLRILSEVIHDWLKSTFYIKGLLAPSTQMETKVDLCVDQTSIKTLDVADLDADKVPQEIKGQEGKRLFLIVSLVSRID